MTYQTVEEGEYILPSCDFTPPTSESFQGWAVGREDATPLKQPGETIDLRENTTLYAKYISPTPYDLSVDCDPNKGYVLVNLNDHTTDARTFAKGANLSFVAMPESGWLVDNWSCSEPLDITDISTPADKRSAKLVSGMPERAVTISLTFKKDPEAKTITLDAKGGSVSPSFIMTNKEGKLKLPNGNLITLPTPTISGKTFKYWATSDGVKYNESATYTEDTTLFAVYEDSLTPDPTPGGAPAPNENGLLPFDLAAELIDAAKAGDTVTYDFGGWHSFPLFFMEKVASRPDLTYVFKCVYESDYYEFTIKPGTKFELNWLWYGPLKMAELFDTKITDAEGKVKSAAKGNPTAGNGVYVIQRGDTLSKLAAQFKRTIEELLRLNSDITDRDYIVAGKNLNY